MAHVGLSLDSTSGLLLGAIGVAWLKLISAAGVQHSQDGGYPMNKDASFRRGAAPTASAAAL